MTDCQHKHTQQIKVAFVSQMRVQYTQDLGSFRLFISFHHSSPPPLPFFFPLSVSLPVGCEVLLSIPFLPCVRSIKEETEGTMERRQGRNQERKKGGQTNEYQTYRNEERKKEKKCLLSFTFTIKQKKRKKERKKEKESGGGNETPKTYDDIYEYLSAAPRGLHGCR